MQYSNIFYVRQPVYGQETFCYIIVMSYTKLEKIFEKLKKNTLSIARKTYDYNLHDDLHDFYYYTNWEKQKFSIWIDVTDPRPGRSGFACWEVRGEVFVDADGNKTYKMRFPFSEAENKIKYYTCAQSLTGMMREMEEWRIKFLKDSYITLCNVATEQIIDSLP